jgi:hypothetical protein
MHVKNCALGEVTGRALGTYRKLDRRNYPAAAAIFLVLGWGRGEGFETLLRIRRTPPMPHRRLSGSAPLFIAAAVILAFVIGLWWLA